MVVSGWKTLMVRCSTCGKIFEDDFNLFSLKTKSKEEFLCECGNKLVAIEGVTKRTATMYINCNGCNGLHKYNFNITDLIINDRTYNCTYGGEICIIGNIKNISNFTNSDIMIKCVKEVDELQIKDKINCKCGCSDIVCDIYSDRLEIRCKSCNGIMIVYAEDEEDLRIIKGKSFIQLEKNNIRCLGSKRDQMRDSIKS